MKIYIAGRGKGKTAHLIQRSHDEWTYILVSNRSRADQVFQLARKLNIRIPFPITVREYINSSEEIPTRKILIDGAEEVLKTLLPRLNVEEITISEESVKE